jgi:poly(hydroxyalkanoate) depolymerase family esterase
VVLTSTRIVAAITILRRSAPERPRIADGHARKSLKIKDRLRAFFRRTSTSPSVDAGAIGATINRALGQAGLLKHLNPGPAQRAQAVRTAVGSPVRDSSRSQFITRTFSCESGSRDYKLFIPSTYSREATARPALIVMLHGCHQSADDTAAGTRMNALAEQEGFLVAYPQQASRSNGSKCWNWFRAEDQERGRGEPAIIAGITAEVSSEFHIDSRRVFVAGLSAGGAMAVIMGATYPDAYAGIGVHSGLPFRAAHDVSSAFSVMRNGYDSDARSPLGRARTVATIVFHGDRDTTVNVRNGEAIIAHALASHGGGPSILRSTTGEAHERHYTHAVYADEEHRDFLETWILHGGGHAWSGGSAEGTHTDESGPDASAEMVRFFFLL